MYFLDMQQLYNMNFLDMQQLYNMNFLDILQLYNMSSLDILQLDDTSFLDMNASKYASSEFRRNYVPLWVLFRKWGMKGVCLRKRWGKWYRRCIVKFNTLVFIELISTFYCVYLWVSI